MFFVGLLAVGVVLLIPVSFLLSLLARQELSRLRGEYAALARRVAAMESRAGILDGPPVVSAPPLAARAPAAAAILEPRGLDLESRVGGQWLTWFGILAIFFGTAFFLAVDLGSHPLAGAGQVAVGVLVGGLFLAIGHLLSRRRQFLLGRGLLGGGVALVFLSAYAAYGFHELIPALVVYPVLLLAGLVGAGVALAHDSLMVATLTLTGAFLTPLLLQAKDDITFALFPYLAAVNLGTMRLAAHRRWPLLPLGGFLGTVILMGFWWATYRTPDHRLPALLLGIFTWALYLGVPLFTAVGTGVWSRLRAAVIAADGLAFTIYLCGLLAPEHTALRGLVTAALAVIHLLAARAARSRRGLSPAVQACHYTGLGLAALAVPLHFARAWETLAWVLLGGTYMASGFEGKRPGHRVAGLAVFLLALFRTLVLDTEHSLSHVEGYRFLLGGDFLAGVLLAAALVLCGLAYRRTGISMGRWEGRLFTPLLLLATSIFLWKLSFESVAFFEARARELETSVYRASLLTLSLVWAAYAGLLVLLGFLARYRPIRIQGVVVLGLLILKVFILDMQVLTRGYRVASFVGVGILLLAISLLYQRERREGSSGASAR